MSDFFFSLNAWGYCIVLIEDCILTNIRSDNSFENNGFKMTSTLKKITALRLCLYYVMRLGNTND